MSKNDEEMKRLNASRVGDAEAASMRLDAVLASEDALVPSSGFLATVMERVEEEARMPQPIPFPWKRAVPGFILASGVAAWASVEFVRAGVPAIKASMSAGAMSAATSAPALRLPAFHLNASASTPFEQAGWVAIALGVSFASWLLASRFGRRSSNHF